MRLILRRRHQRKIPGRLYVPTGVLEWAGESLDDFAGRQAEMQTKIPDLEAMFDSLFQEKAAKITALIRELSSPPPGAGV